jgi:hypothetical protein
MAEKSGFDGAGVMAQRSKKPSRCIPQLTDANAWRRFGPLEMAEQ